ncbi:hypothetical protein Halru_2051 [Halovivax ruber XH-70]|uniref:Uncharacterized protein n=1 Tax=Halovivax ruber (strain DSM 18193 / JCM 13892 / XH-70) TaxID=797302 RepID=L0IAM0_HALRX|nr:hypothetical protein Halru_2051 [Halovivax ruber XH-70]
MIAAPECDPDLHGHSAIVRESLCHAVVSDLHDVEYRSDLTECGMVLGRGAAQETDLRKSIAERGVEMCPDCWPAHVVSEDHLH